MDAIMLCGIATLVILISAIAYTVMNAPKKEKGQSENIAECQSDQTSGNGEDVDEDTHTNQNDAEAFFIRGNLHREAHRHLMAIEDYSRAIKLNTYYTEAYINRGNTYRDLNLNILALQDYTEAIHLNPNDALAFYNRGIVYADLDNHEEAIDDIEAAIRLNPDIISVAYKARQIIQGKMKAG